MSGFSVPMLMYYGDPGMAEHRILAKSEKIYDIHTVYNFQN